MKVRVLRRRAHQKCPRDPGPAQCGCAEPAGSDANDLKSTSLDGMKARRDPYWRMSIRHVALVAVGGFAVACRPHPAKAPEAVKDEPSAPSVASPLNATYQFESQSIALVNGQVSISSARTEIRQVGEIVQGDVDGDAAADAIFVVNVESGGSGSFQYLTAALSRGDQFQGLNFVFLGDRIVTESLLVRRGVIEVSYLTRGPSEPMSARPSVRKLGYSILDGDQLQKLIVLDEGEQLFEALVTIGGEVRAMRPCNTDKRAWISGKSPALRAIITTRESVTAKPYTPMLMVLVGRLSNERDKSEFGSAYQMTFYATQLVRSLPQSTC